MLNAVETGTGTVVAIHRRVAKDGCFVVLRGKVRGGECKEGAYEPIGPEDILTL